MAEAQGLATVLQMLQASGRMAATSDGQADMFGAEDAPLPLPRKGKSGPLGGRPRNAVNRSTEEWARWLLGQYQSPLIVLAELYSRPLGELVDELQEMADKHKSWRATKDGGYWDRVAISPLDVLKLQREAAVALAPYLHKQQPKAVEISDDRPRGVMILGSLEVDPMDDPEAIALPLPPAPLTVENQ